ncbi:MAG TPA: nucleotide sugar dehydrogenase [bacterium]|nr:nucleotide sugar dehydrogenase [bacterium]
MTRLSVVGLGKLGTCTATCFAYRGFPVLGMDSDPGVVDAVNAGRAPVQEPGLDELIAGVRGRLRATTDYGTLVDESDVTFLIVPTPSEEGGRFSDRYLRLALMPLAGALREHRKPYHLFVVTSTVSPGTTDGTLIPLIERGSGRLVGEGFGVCYGPEFIALGSVIRDFLQPDLVLIGESDERAGETLAEIYRATHENSPYVARMSIISAEITKLSLNAYVTMKISFANTLASICASVPGADVDAITSALGADHRISPWGLKGGLPYGGPCFPRDNRAFAAFAGHHGVGADLALATDTVNRDQTRRLVDLVIDAYKTHHAARAAVLGLAYKPNTPVTDESAAVAVVNALLDAGAAVTVYDPLAAPAARRHFGDRVGIATSARQAMAESPFTVITLPLPEFAAIDDSYIISNPAVIVDCWRVLAPARFRKAVTYVALGRHHDGAA